MTVTSEDRDSCVQRITAAISAGRKDVRVSRKDSARLHKFLTKQFAVLTIETIARMDALIAEGYNNHVISLLVNNDRKPYPNDFVNNLFKSLPHFNEDQLEVALKITRDCFGCLHLYREGDVFYLQHMVKDYASYLQLPGVVDLPYLTNAERELFTMLHGKDEIIRSIRERKLSSQEVTVELVNEMSSMHSELVEGVL